MRNALIGISGFAAILLLGLAVTGYDFAMFKFWAPKYADVRREVFENTQGYVEGKTAYLTTLRYQFTVSAGDQKTALRTLILSEASTVDNNKLPADLRSFIEGLKGGL